MVRISFAILLAGQSLEATIVRASGHNPSPGETVAGGFMFLALLICFAIALAVEGRK
jgi:hypothetical protein